MSTFQIRILKIWETFYQFFKKLNKKGIEAYPVSINWSMTNPFCQLSTEPCLINSQGFPNLLMMKVVQLRWCQSQDSNQFYFMLKSIYFWENYTLSKVTWEINMRMFTSFHGKWALCFLCLQYSQNSLVSSCFRSQSWA